MKEAINVHALGPSGCGKTVFMASLYTRMRMQREGMAFYLKTGHNDAAMLTSIYNQVANPEESWPPASQSVQTWEFTLCVQSKTGDFEPLTFRYLDYPGGILTNPAATTDVRISKLIQDLKKANALLILLDGLAMKSLMRGGRPGQRYLEFDLASSLDIAQQARCPIHFVVTKWDLLEKECTLEDLREKLLADDNIKDLLRAKKAQDNGATIRLIPVSSVGRGFATISSDGVMRKTGKKPQPYNVEIPLAAILPDFLAFAAKERLLTSNPLGNASNTQSQKNAASQSQTDWSGKISKWLTAATTKVLPRVLAANGNPRLATLLASNPEVVAKAVNGATSRVIKTIEQRRSMSKAEFSHKIERERLNAANEEEAFDVLQDNVTATLFDFEMAYPESILLGGLNLNIRKAKAAEFGRK